MSLFTKRNSRAAKLSTLQVIEIREKYNTGSYTQASLAREYGVTVVQIGRIVRGEVWQSIRSPMPTQAEFDESAKRLMAIQHEVNILGPQARLDEPPEVQHVDPVELMKRFYGRDKEEPEGSGLDRLRKEAEKSGDGMITELTGEKK